MIISISCNMLMKLNFSMVTTARLAGMLVVTVNLQ